MAAHTVTVQWPRAVASRAGLAGVDRGTRSGALQQQQQQLCLQRVYVLAIPLTVIQFQVVACRYLLRASQCLLIFTVFLRPCIMFGGSLALGI